MYFVWIWWKKNQYRSPIFVYCFQHENIMLDFYEYLMLHLLKCKLEIEKIKYKRKQNGLV